MASAGAIVCGVGGFCAVVGGVTCGLGVPTAGVTFLAIVLPMATVAGLLARGGATVCGAGATGLSGMVCGIDVGGVTVGVGAGADPTVFTAAGDGAVRGTVGRMGRGCMVGLAGGAAWVTCGGAL